MLKTSIGVSYEKRAWLLIAAVLAFRLLYAALFATNPAGDEAYYWDWGRRLDIGYYSKPPFIAWLYAFVDWAGGGSLFAIRATSAIFAAVSAAVLFYFTRDLFDSRAGWIAVVLASAIPANSVLSFFLTIDAPLVLCWSVALWMFWRCLRGEGKTGSYLALFLALAIGHLSKQMMMLFPVLAAIYVALHPDTRPLFRHKKVWIVMLLSYLSLIPPLVWNAQHGWITFKHTSHHFESGSGDGNIFVERIGEFLSFLGTQLGVLSPLIAVALYGLCFSGLIRIRKIQSQYRYLTVFSAIPLALMLLLALRQTLQPNWPAVFYVPGVALTAAWFSGSIQTHFKDTFRTKYFKNAIIVGVCLAAYFYLSPLVFQALGMAGHTADPNRRLMGYDILCEKVDSIRKQEPDASEFLITVGHRDLTSQLAFGLEDQPLVYHWQKEPGVRSQYELWNTPIEDGRAGDDALVLVPNGGKVPHLLKKAFASVEKVDEFALGFGYKLEKTFSVWRGIDLQTWPDLSRESPPKTPRQ